MPIPPEPGPSIPEKATAIVLLSGGLDSATCLALAAADGYSPLALSFRYGQRHAVELDAAAALAAAHGAEQVVVDIDLARFGGSALTDHTIAVPKHDAIAPANGESRVTEIPITYVPARNTIFLSYALALAEVRHARDIYIGVNALDYSGYPDCRPEYIDAFTTMANLSTRAAVEGARLTVHTPLIDLSKAQIARLACDLGVDTAATVSCYDPDLAGAACGSCDACRLRAKGFADAGLADPTRYQAATSEDRSR